MKERQHDEHQRDGDKGEHGDDPPLFHVRFRELVLGHQPLVEAVDGARNALIDEQGKKRRDKIGRASCRERV